MHLTKLAILMAFLLIAAESTRIHAGAMATGLDLEVPKEQIAPGAEKTNYARYPGTATIVRIEKTDASNANKGDADEGYEVWFTFVPKEPVKDKSGQDYLARFKEHKFVLANGWDPGPKFLKKYGIEKSKEFACTLMVETQGTGTPIMLQLNDVPSNDYFESAAH